jgi:hypothetical protein
MDMTSLGGKWRNFWRNSHQINTNTQPIRICMSRDRLLNERSFPGLLQWGLPFTSSFMIKTFLTVAILVHFLYYFLSLWDAYRSNEP